jgi:hypothetical protein
MITDKYIGDFSVTTDNIINNVITVIGDADRSVFVPAWSSARLSETIKDILDTL